MVGGALRAQLFRSKLYFLKIYIKVSFYLDTSNQIFNIFNIILNYFLRIKTSFLFKYITIIHPKPKFLLIFLLTIQIPTIISVKTNQLLY